MTESWQMRALVIEDDEGSSRITQRLLEAEGFAVDTAETAREGTRLAGAADYSVIILDLGLPDGSGMAVLEGIRQRSQRTPVLIASGAGELQATVAALDAGADDYLHKPFHAEELTARVRALVRRDHLLDAPTLSCGNIVLHRLDRTACVGDAVLQLTAKEFALLEFFLAHQGRTLTREELLKGVWRFDFNPGTNMVDVNVSRLRGKLVELGASCHVDAVRGIGYVFVEP